MEYTVIRQKRKTFAITVNDHLQVIVKVPKYLAKRDIQQLMTEHEAWIQKTIEQKKAHIESNDWFKTGQILYFGQCFLVKCEEGASQVPHVSFEPEKGFTVWSKKEEEARHLMAHYYREEAKSYLTELTKKYGQMIGVNYQKITIRNQTTRWGSCSTRGNLSYNLKLLCAPSEMIEYVVLHEVMHLKYFNHSEAFWKAIEEVMPNYRHAVYYFRKFGRNFII